MPDLDHIQRDKATILSIIKYAMFAVIIAAAVFYGFRLVWILLPFLIGFILARVAGKLASFWLDMTYRIKRRKDKKAGISQPAAPLPETTVIPECPEIIREVPGQEIIVEGATPDSTVKQPRPAQYGRRKQGLYPHGLAASRKETKLAVFFYFLEVIALICLVVGVIIGTLSQLRSLAVYLPSLIGDANLSQRLTNYLNELSNRMGGLIQADFLQIVENELANLQQKLIEAVPGIATGILNSVGAFVGYLPIFFFIIIVIIMSGYYFITDSRSLYVFLRRNITSKTFREKSIRLVNSLSSTLFRVIGGYLLLLIVTFIEALIGLLIIKMPYAVIIAVVASIVDFLPVLGISATLIPVAAYQFINGNIYGGLGALVLLAIMSMVRRVIEPAILGNAMSLHPMATLAAMIIGIALYGLTGIIIGPIILVIARQIMTLFGFDKKIRSLIGDMLNKVSS